MYKSFILVINYLELEFYRQLKEGSMSKATNHSEHIFLFPFTWQIFKGKLGDKSFTGRTNIEYIKKVFSSDWEMQIFQTNEPIHYNEYIYFFPSVRSALYTTKDKNEVVYNFKYKKTQQGISKYIIEVDNTQYSLDINEIKLRLYKTGIGILSFHLDNNLYSQPEDILKINNFGRRVYPPFLPLEKVKNKLLAQKLIVKINNTEIIEEDFEKPYDQYPVQISKTIMALLGHKFSTISKDLKRGDIYIQPVIDDRMFVICWYTNPDLSSQICNKNTEGIYGYMDSVFWYRYLFADGKGVSCKNDTMMGALLKDHTYDRWIDDHILYGVTKYSFMGIGANKSPAYQIYDQLVCLTMVQRASVLHFSNEVSRIAILPKVKLVMAIRSLYEYHILFMNHLYFREVTADNQGIEFYERLIEEMKIPNDISMLDAEIEEVNEYATLIAQESSQKRTNAITVIGAALIIPTLVTGFFGMNVFQNKLSNWWVHPELKLWFNAYFILPVSLVIFICMLRPHRTFRYIILVLLIGVIALLSLYMVYKLGCGL